MNRLWTVIPCFIIILTVFSGCAIAPTTSTLDQQPGPKAAKDYYARGLALAKKGQYDKAIEDFTTALEQVPDYGKAYMNRGIAYTKTGNSEKAAADFAKCCNLGYQDGCNAAIQWVTGGKMGGPLNFSRD